MSMNFCPLPDGERCARCGRSRAEHHEDNGLACEDDGWDDPGDLAEEIALLEQEEEDEEAAARTLGLI